MVLPPYNDHDIQLTNLQCGSYITRNHFVINYEHRNLVFSVIMNLLVNFERTISIHIINKHRPSENVNALIDFSLNINNKLPFLYYCIRL